MHQMITTVIVLYFLFIPRVIDAQDLVQAKDTSSAGTGDSLVSAVVHDTSYAGTSADTTGIKKDSIDTITELSETSDTGGQTETVASGQVSSSKKSVHQRELFGNSVKTQEQSIKRFVASGKRLAGRFMRYIQKIFLLVVFGGIIIGTVIYFRRKVDSHRFLTSTRLSTMDKEVQLACRFIEKNYSNADLSVASICEALVTGPAFLEALFDKELGMSVSDFLLYVRINRAKLFAKKQPDATPDEIFASIGFTDNDTFLKAFARTTGVTFEAYQQSLHNETIV